MNTEHTNEQIESFARSTIVLAQGSGMKLWDARERLIQAFDREAECRDAKHIESLGGGE